jgi:hypothetical protein
MNRALNRRESTLSFCCRGTYNSSSSSKGNVEKKGEEEKGRSTKRSGKDEKGEEKGKKKKRR